MRIPLTGTHWVPDQATAEVTAALKAANALTTSGEAGLAEKKT